jgi:hypothetical protein
MGKACNMMTVRRILVAVVLVLHLPVDAAEEKASASDARPKPLMGDYQVYGGTLSEMSPPSRSDRKVSFKIKGPLAKELFDHIGPDLKTACSDVPGYRERGRRDLSCTFTKENGFACYLGLDVVTGRSMIGAIC